MAREIPDGLVTVPATTGLKQFRFVALNTSGQAAYPSAGATIFGVTYSGGTTGSTTVPQHITVQTRGVAKVEAPGSTVSAGDTVAASSVGRAVALSAGNYAVGMVHNGSSGSTGRLLGVLLSPIGTT